MRSAGSRMRAASRSISDQRNRAISSRRAPVSSSSRSSVAYSPPSSSARQIVASSASVRTRSRGPFWTALGVMLTGLKSM